MNQKITIVYLTIIVLIFSSCKKDEPIEPLKSKPIESNKKEIVSFQFLVADNSALSEDVDANIDSATHTITAILPMDTKLSELTPTITLSAKATVNPIGAQDFSNAVTYTVVAENRSTINYTVGASRELSEKGILQVLLDANPENTLDWDLQNTTDLDELNGVKLNAQDKIIELDLPAKNLDILPTEIGQLENLEYLLLGENNLKTLPDGIGLLSNLKFLGLSVNQLTALPDELWQLSNLEELYLNSNRLAIISPGIGKLTKLIVLSLGSNQLTIIPKEIGELNQLIDLSLYNNQLSEIPAETSQLLNLESLFLTGNKLTSIPPELGLLTNLNVLNLQSNQLSTLPAELGFLLDLNHLDIRDNAIISVPHSINYLTIFSPQPIDFNHDLITFQNASMEDVLISIYSANPSSTLEWSVGNFPDVDFNENNNPTGLHLNNKNISRIPINIENLTSLDVLLANNNRIAVLPSTLGNVNSLVVLELGNNLLSTLPSGLGLLNNLQLLNITNNPFINMPQEVCNLQTSNGGILTIVSDVGEGCD